MTVTSSSKMTRARPSDINWQGVQISDERLNCPSLLALISHFRSPHNDRPATAHLHFLCSHPLTLQLCSYAASCVIIRLAHELSLAVRAAQCFTESLLLLFWASLDVRAADRCCDTRRRG